MVHVMDYSSRRTYCLSDCPDDILSNVQHVGKVSTSTLKRPHFIGSSLFVLVGSCVETYSIFKEPSAGKYRAKAYIAHVALLVGC